MKKIAVTYYSKTGNTEKLAKAIGEELGCPISTVYTTIAKPVDILFLGTAVYTLGISKKMANYISLLDPAKIGKVAIFSTSSQPEQAYTKIAELLKERGIEVCEENFLFKSKFFNAHLDGPNEDDVTNIKKFARQIVGE